MHCSVRPGSFFASLSFEKAVLCTCSRSGLERLPLRTKLLQKIEDFDCTEKPKNQFQEFQMKCWMCSTTGAGASSLFPSLDVVFFDVCECGVVVVCVWCAVCVVVVCVLGFAPVECCDNFHDSFGDLRNWYVHELLRTMCLVNVGLKDFFINLVRELLYEFP